MSAQRDTEAYGFATMRVQPSQCPSKVAAGLRGRDTAKPH